MSINPQLLQQLYHHPVAEKLQLARDLFYRHRAVFTAERAFTAALERLRTDAELLADHMTAMNMGALCVACSAGANGGCCSLYMAGETDSVQLLMNMLAGVDVAVVRNDSFECCYLGQRGCIFLFKPMFCLNYNCTKIMKDAAPAEIAKLERLTGELLRCQYEVEKLLLAIIASQIKR